jgi:hypothetical protein
MDPDVENYWTAFEFLPGVKVPRCTETEMMYSICLKSGKEISFTQARRLKRDVVYLC